MSAISEMGLVELWNSGMVKWIFFPMLTCLLLFYGLVFSLPAFIFRQFCYCVHECCFFVFVFAMICTFHQVL